VSDISIIIPTYNRAASLTQALGSAANLVDPNDTVEFVIVDNGSTDQTAEAWRAIKEKFPKQQWRYFYDDMPGLLTGRHCGALEAKGDICVFLDDDVRVSRGWLRALEDAFRNPDVALVGGPSLPRFESDPPDWLASFYKEDQNGRHCGWLSLIDAGDSVKEIDPCYVWGLNFAIRRKVLFDLKGFHPDSVPKSLQRFQGDGETGLSLKIKRAGLKALYHPQVSVQHEVPASRLTVGYFEQRAFFQGVCDSYTRIRSEGRVAQSERSWKDPLRRIKRLLFKMTCAGKTPQNEIQNRTAKAYKTGYSFHQGEVRRDRSLLNWVLREDYWNYELPEGWESCLLKETSERAEKER
jgi:glycosyltransferase involved in cell wall biosynthesis